MLELNCGQTGVAREHIKSSLEAFETASEHGALLTCVAAGVCYAHAQGQHVTALWLIGSLPGEATRRLSPAHWHRWVVRALKSSRRATGVHIGQIASVAEAKQCDGTGVENRERFRNVGVGEHEEP